DQAIDQLEKILTKNENCYEALMAVAVIYEKQKDLPSAIKALKRATKASRTAVEPHMRLADIYEKIGLDDLADEHQEIANQLRKQQKKPRRKKK
ncbi:MAG: hypothetical protein J5629_05395, partial [Muribaculaceae bacterium]|nr:hypothetical protein [Muribaculaceae bacterium]